MATLNIFFGSNVAGGQKAIIKPGTGTFQVSVTSPPVWLPNWKYGIVVRENLTNTNNSVFFDSFDSSNPLYSTNGQYDAGKAKANFYMICSSSASSSVALGNSVVDGNVGAQQGTTTGLITGAGNYTLFLTNSFQEYIQSGSYPSPLYLPNSIFTPQTLPYTTGSSIPSNNTITGSGDYSTPGNYGPSVLSVSSSFCRIVVNGNFTPSAINLSSSSSVLIYVSGSTNNFSNVTTNAASNLVCYFAQSGSSIVLNNGNINAMCIEAPLSKITTGGTVNDYVGYIICDTIRISTNKRFHMDEATNRVIT